MVNYIRSEFYRTIKNKNYKIMCGVFAVLIVTYVALVKYMKYMDPNFTYANTRFTLGSVYMELTMIFTVIVVYSALYDNGECVTHTIKHSISFGISRNTIYLGRLIVQAILGAVVYLVMSILLIALSYLLLEHSNVNELSSYIHVTFACSTCLLATLAVAHFFIMNKENQVLGLILPVVIMVIIPSAFNLLGRKIDVIKSIAYYLPYNIVAGDGNIAQGKDGIEEIIVALLVGVIWLIVFTIWGLIKFNKKEVK